MRSQKKINTTNRRMEKTPRKAYCTGCGITFPKMHILINHRRTDKCGGKYLSEEEYLHLMSMRKIREDLERKRRDDLKKAKAIVEGRRYV
jgi:hypothetical protein